MDPRDQLAQMISGYQPELATRTRMPGGTPVMGPPPSQMGTANWTPTPTAPFGGLDETNWKQPGTPQFTGQAPIGMSQQWIDDTTGVYNSMRARGELPFDVNPAVDLNNPALWRQVQRDSQGGYR
jgi:hypothetical protein